MSEKMLCSEEETDIIKDLLRNGEPLPPNVGQFENGSYYRIEEEANTTDIQYGQSNNTFLYVISLLIPLVGFITGAIMLSSDDKKETGKMCVILGLVSTVICVLLYLMIVGKVFSQI